MVVGVVLTTCGWGLTWLWAWSYLQVGVSRPQVSRVGEQGEVLVAEGDGDVDKHTVLRGHTWQDLADT